MLPIEQVLHLVAFLLVALAMGLMMAPAAYHRQVERGRVTRRFVDLSSALLTTAMVPLIAGLSLDTYLLSRLILPGTILPALAATIVALTLAGLWFGLPAVCRRLKD